MAKEEGEVGKKKLERITRYTTVGLGLLMGVAYTIMLNNYNILSADANFLSYVVIVLALHRRPAQLCGWRADHRVRHWQRYFHDSVRQHHFPDSTTSSAW